MSSGGNGESAFAGGVSVAAFACCTVNADAVVHADVSPVSNPSENTGAAAAGGSPRDGLTSFGRDVIRECEKLGIIIDLAHISPAGFDDIIEMTTRPVIISHTNARKYYDIERNVTDEQIKAVGARRGVIGISAVLVSPEGRPKQRRRPINFCTFFPIGCGISRILLCSSATFEWKIRRAK